MLRIGSEKAIILQKKCYKFSDKEININNKLFNIPRDIINIVFQYVFIGDLISFLFTCKYLLQKYYNVEYFYYLAKCRLNTNREQITDELIENKEKIKKYFNSSHYNDLISKQFLKKYTKNIYTYLYSLLAFPEYYIGINKIIKQPLKITFNSRYCRTPYLHDLSLDKEAHYHRYTSIIINKTVKISSHACKCLAEKLNSREEILVNDIKKADPIGNLKNILIAYNPKYTMIKNNIIKPKDIIRLDFCDIYVRNNNTFLINDVKEIVNDTKPKKAIKYYEYYQGICKFCEDTLRFKKDDENSDPSDSSDSYSN